MINRREESNALKKATKLIQQHIFEALSASQILEVRFRFYFRDNKGKLKILAARIVSWQFQNGRLYLDTSSPSIEYLLISKKGVSMVGSSGGSFEGRMEVY